MTAKQLIAAAAACVECGKEHQPRKSPLGQWTWAAKDGHNYRARIHMMTNEPADAVIKALRQLAA